MSISPLLLFRLHLQSHALRHRRGRRARHRCRRSKGPTVQTIALDVRHVTADVLCSTEQLRLSWESTFSPCVHPCGCCRFESAPSVYFFTTCCFMFISCHSFHPPCNTCITYIPHHPVTVSVPLVGSPSLSFFLFIHQITYLRIPQL